MTKEELLQAGENVKIRLTTGEEFEGRIAYRTGIGSAKNYIPSQEIINVKNEKQGIEVSLSNIKDVERI